MTDSVLTPTALYLGDNGRCFCGEHAGASAKCTGVDLSGLPVVQVGQLLVNDHAAEMGSPAVFGCEEPSCDREIRSEVRPGHHSDGECDTHGLPTYGGECEACEAAA